MESYNIEPQRRQPAPASGILRRSFTISGYTVTFTLMLDALTPGAKSQTNIEWSPDLPRRPLSKAEWKLYRKRRNAIIQEFANITGGNLMVVD